VKIIYSRASTSNQAGIKVEPFKLKARWNWK